MILALAVHVVNATGLWRDLRDVEPGGSVEIWAGATGWTVDVTATYVVLRPGGVSTRTAS